jgi:SAM-dependent methyltransferase
VETAGSKPQAIAPPGLHEIAINLVQKYVPAGRLVADLCAGEGAFSLRLLEAEYQVIPVDVDTRWFKVPALSVIQADLNRPFTEGLGRGRFDCVVCLEGIEHLENPWDFIRQCRSLLKSGGTLLLSSPNVECLLSRLIFLIRGSFLTFDRTMKCPNHLTPILSWLLEYNLAQSGFTVREIAFTPPGWAAKHNWKIWLLSYTPRILFPFLDQSWQGETRVVVAEAEEGSV